MKSHLLVFTALLLIACLVGPVAAASITTNKTTELTDISSYSFTPDEGYVIYEILINPTSMGTNQTHHLYYDEAEFTLSVGSYTEWWIYHNFDISLTYPNGTTSTNHAVWTGVSAGTYTLDIQPVFYQAQSINLGFSVWLNVGITDPLLVEFFTLPADVCYGGDYCSKYVAAESAIPFTFADGTMGDTTTVYIYQISESDFVENIQNYNPIYGWTSLTEDAGKWAYNQIISSINMIPVIGPLTISMMSIIGTVGGEILYWLKWIITNGWLVIAGGEVLIAMCAVIAAGKDKSGVKSAKNFVNYNVACINGILIVINYLWTWLVQGITMIVGLLQALKTWLGL